MSMPQVNIDGHARRSEATSIAARRADWVRYIQTTEICNEIVLSKLVIRASLHMCRIQHVHGCLTQPEMTHWHPYAIWFDVKVRAHLINSGVLRSQLRSMAKAYGTVAEGAHLESAGFMRRSWS